MNSNQPKESNVNHNEPIQTESIDEVLEQIRSIIVDEQEDDYVDEVYFGYLRMTFDPHSIKVRFCDVDGTLIVPEVLRHYCTFIDDTGKTGEIKINLRLTDYIINVRRRTGQNFHVEERYTTSEGVYHRALIVSEDGERRRMYYDDHSRRWRIA